MITLERSRRDRNKQEPSWMRFTYASVLNRMNCVINPMIEAFKSNVGCVGMPPHSSEPLETCDANLDLCFVDFDRCSGPVAEDAKARSGRTWSLAEQGKKSSVKGRKIHGLQTRHRWRVRIGEEKTNFCTIVKCLALAGSSTSR